MKRTIKKKPATRAKKKAPQPRRKKIGSKLNPVSKEWEVVFELSNVTQQRILTYLQHNEFLGVGSGDIARAVGIRQAEAIAHLAALQKAGYATYSKTCWRRTNKAVEN